MQNNPMKQLDRLAWLLDNSIPVPGTSWRIGLDGVLGLLPGVGDLLAGATSSYILFYALKMGVPLPVLLRMGLNILLESVVGTIPVVGDVFDFAFKANQRNVDLMRQYVQNPTQVKQRSTWMVVLVVAGFFALIIALIWLVWSIVAAIVSALF